MPLARVAHGQDQFGSGGGESRADDRLDRAGTAPLARRTRPPVPPRRAPPPARGADSDHISPGLLRILDRLADTPAEIVTELGETLRQSPLGVALTGGNTGYTGPARSLGYRWFTDPATRQLYAPEDPPFLSRMFAAGLRGIVTLRGPGSRAAHFADLLARSEEFRRVWDGHEVGIRPNDTKRFVHPELGALELNCQRLLDPQQSHALLVYTAVPGTESYEKLQLLSVIGRETVRSGLDGGTAHGRSAGW